MSGPVDNSIAEDVLTQLATDAVPHGVYLLEELRDGTRVLWRISDGAPDDAALDPADEWTLMTTPAAPSRHRRRRRTSGGPSRAWCGPRPPAAMS